MKARYADLLAQCEQAQLDGDDDRVAVLLDEMDAVWRRLSQRDRDAFDQQLLQRLLKR